jgi:hypothetical protein
MDAASIGGNRYALILNDRTSSYTFIDTMLGNNTSKHVIPTLIRMLDIINLQNKFPKFIHADSDPVFTAQT